MRIGKTRPRLGGCALAELGLLFCDEQNPKRTWRTNAGQSFHNDQFGVSATVVKPELAVLFLGRLQRSLDRRRKKRLNLAADKLRLERRSSPTAKLSLRADVRSGRL
ncbi:protein of unknown function [Candidatus Filomicrobium marinum]|uniref:Uncharacterized protein n=1 Tax=Candidatus Filomicrobium marinum TaxID=1608628 RepID=A0A0D6JDB0_9HYPH|nr:protein of unknown function [Candidatus Filomicrobium marinum]CPR16931.1 protein of unknown function [Candidatus Filomicrobium marinum]